MHVVLLMYVDDFILIGPTDELIDEAILTMQDNADVEDKGDLCQYVRVLAKRIDEFTIVLRQPHLIEAIIIDLQLDDNSKPASTPMLCSVVLCADLDGEPHDIHFNYSSVVGKLNYLSKST